MITSEYIEELKLLVEESQIKEECEEHPLGNSGKVTVFPQSEEEISSILKFSNDNGLSISIIGGGTKRGYGGTNEHADIMLSLAKYKGIVEHTPGDMTLTVKAGTPFKELQDYLAQHNQKISLDPFWPEHATIGGVIAANESGPKRLGYGSARDAVIGLRMVYPDGLVIRSGGRVVKNVAGYDMNKLFIGSMGTLGVVSEVTVKLRPLPKKESVVLFSFPEGNLDEIRAFAVKVLDSMIEPISLELLSPTLAEKLAGQKQYTLTVSFEDVESSVRYQEEFIKGIQPARTKAVFLEQADAKKFWDQFYKICPNGAIEKAEGETEASLKIGVLNLDVLKVLKESEVLQDANNVSIEAHGGLGHGLCQVNIRGAREDVLEAIQQLKSYVYEMSGYVVVKHLPLSLRQKIEVWGEKPSYFFLLEGIKVKVDPNKTLNPNRFVGGI